MKLAVFAILMTLCMGMTSAQWWGYNRPWYGVGYGYPYYGGGYGGWGGYGRWGGYGGWGYGGYGRFGGGWGGGWGGRRFFGNFRLFFFADFYFYLN